MWHTPRPHIFSGNGTVKEVTRLINVDDDIELVTVERLISYFMEGRIKPYPFTIPARVRVYPRGRPRCQVAGSSPLFKKRPFIGHSSMRAFQRRITLPFWAPLFWTPQYCDKKWEITGAGHCIAQNLREYPWY